MSKLSFITDERLKEILNEFIDFMKYFKYEEKSLNKIYYKIDNDILHFIITTNDTVNYEDNIFTHYDGLSSDDVFLGVIRDTFVLIERVNTYQVKFEIENIYNYVEIEADFKELII